MNNTLFTGDCLHVLTGMNSASVDLIYLDPPFNSKRIYSAPVGSKAAGTSFKDMWAWQDVDEDYLENLIDNYPHLVQYINSIEAIHSKGMMAYITYMTQRIIEMKRVLKDTGSIYLHCDPTASHYLKIVLDRIFGKENFKNEVIWSYGLGGSSKRFYSRKHDSILYYQKSDNAYFNKPQVPATSAMLKNKMKGCPDVWAIPSLNNMAKERTGYPTQKPLKLLYRIIVASSNVGDVILDPFCGCATTCVAAQQLDRKWIGIDVEKKSAELVVSRLSDDGGLFSDFVRRTDVPKRTDVIYEPPTNISNKLKLYNNQDKQCAGCSVEMDIQHFEVDHIIPKSKGGGDYYENYQLLCGNCNRIKGNRPMEFLSCKIRLREKEMKKVTFGEIKY